MFELGGIQEEIARVDTVEARSLLNIHCAQSPTKHEAAALDGVGLAMGARTCRGEKPS